MCVEKLLWPDLFIIGGGISKYSEKYIPHLTVEARVVTAQFLNEAGIVGAALAARDSKE
jgi:polyphosphate glucokinase